MKIERIVTVTRDVGSMVIGLAGSAWLLINDSTNVVAYAMCAALIGLPAGFNLLALKPGNGGGQDQSPTRELSSHSPLPSPQEQSGRQSSRSQSNSPGGNRGRRES